MVQHFFQKNADRDRAERQGTDGVQRSFVSGDARQKPFEILSPSELRSPVIFASPHSGRIYPTELLEATKLERSALRQSEDCYVDLLFANVPQFGSPLLKALFPRAYVDVNRKADELDPRMFVGELSLETDAQSSRVLSGLGVVPRIVADGQNIYGRKLSQSDAQLRLEMCYRPYHEALRQLIADARKKFGVAILIDCHSMPAIGGTPVRVGEPALDFVIGDRFGTSAAPALPGLIDTFLSRRGYHVARNAPYAGGYVANAYGRPARGVHVVQIEINRALYLDEEKFARTSNFDVIKGLMEELAFDLTMVDPRALAPAWAAE